MADVEEKSKTEFKPERLPERENFIEWYNALLPLAEMADRSYPVKGTFIWLPYGLKVMKRIVHIFDEEFSKNGIEEVLFPLFVPLDFAEQNDSWFEGFKDEAFYIEGKELLLRPTGEPALYPIFKTWVKNGKIPIRIYQTVSSYRNEGRTTHTMIRDREISFWHEIHTVHKTREESVNEAEMHKRIYDYMWNKVLNIPSIIVAKPKYEVFSGADSAFEFYSILPDGRMLENGSVNNLGQAYAKKFDISYTNDNGEKEYVWQVCTGNGARLIAALISIHGDKKGLVLPPQLAPISAVVVPIPKSSNKERVTDEAKRLSEKLSHDLGVNVYCDDSSVTPGEKFYVWEIKGVPLRIEIGEKELEEQVYTVFRRDTNTRIKVKSADISAEIKKLLEKDIPENMFANATKLYSEKIKMVESAEEAKALINNSNIAKANWCESKECFDSIINFGPSIEAIGTLTSEKRKGKCIICHKETDKLTLIGKNY